MGAWGTTAAGSGFIWLPRRSDLLNHLVTGSTLYTVRTPWRCLYSPSLPVFPPKHNAAKKITKASFCVPTTYHPVVYLITRPWFFYRFWFYTGRCDGGFVPALISPVLCSSLLSLNHFYNILWYISIRCNFYFKFISIFNCEINMHNYCLNYSVKKTRDLWFLINQFW